MIKPYLSHPPFSYYFLYSIRSLFGFNYVLLNVVLVSISAFFVYLTICLLTLKRAKSEFSIFAFFGMVMYLFSFPILRFQLYNFHPDIFVLPFLIIAQYLFLKLLMKERYRSIKYIVMISAVLTVMAYSSWFGAVFNFIIILIAIINLRKGYKLTPYIFIVSTITIGVALLIYSQYSYIGGWKNVIFYFKDTYLRESPFSGHIRLSFIEILWQLIKYLGFLIIPFALLVAFSFVKKKRKFIFTKNGYRYLIITFLPIAIYSLLLLNYFQNPFASLYFVAPLAVCISIWLEKLFKANYNHWTAAKIVGMVVLSNLSLFFILN